MKKYIELNSTVDISIPVEGLRNINTTNYATRENSTHGVSEYWSKSCVMVHKGVGTYPIQLKNAPVFSYYVQEGKFVVIRELEDTNDTTAIKDEKRLEENTKAYNEQKKQIEAVQSKQKVSALENAKRLVASEKKKKAVTEKTYEVEAGELVTSEEIEDKE